MSMDKEELMEMFKACKEVSYDLKDKWLRNLAINVLLGAITLMEIRESIDRLRVSIEEASKKIDDVSGELGLVLGLIAETRGSS